MRTARRILQWLLCVLLAACASPLPAARPIVVEPPRLPPPPSDVMVERPPTFLNRLLEILSISPPKQTQ